MEESYGEARERIHAEQAELDRLRERYAGWRIWTVPRLGAPTTWHAQPRTLPVDANSAEEIEAAIKDANDMYGWDDEHNR